MGKNLFTCSYKRNYSESSLINYYISCTFQEETEKKTTCLKIQNISNICKVFLSICLNEMVTETCKQCFQHVQTLSTGFYCGRINGYVSREKMDF